MISQKRAVAWSAVERFSAQGIQFILGIIIARLVDPACYGLVAMLFIFISIGQSLIDSGFSNALIHKLKCNDIDYSTVFYFNLFVSIFIYVIIYFSSNYIAYFYNQPDLELITKYSALIFIINSLSIVQRTRLTRQLDFKKQSIATVGAVIISGIIGITLAYYDYGVWAIVSQTLINAFVSMVLLWYLSRWKPKLIFSMTSFKQLFSFGSKLLITGLITTIYNNLYTLVIGKYYQSADLGYFNRMQQIASFPTKNFTMLVSRAVYPKQCQLQNDNASLMSNYSDLFKYTSFIILPIMTTLAGVSRPLVNILLGSKWVSAASYLTILCFAYMFDHIQYFNWQILAVKGRSDLSLISEIIKKIISVIILVITLFMGLEALLWGLVVYSFFDIIIIIPFVHKVLPDVTYVREVKLLTKPVILSICCFIACKIICTYINSSYLSLLISLSSVFLIIITGAKLFKVKELCIVIDMAKKYRR